MITRFIDGSFIGQSYIDTLRSDNRDFLVKILMNNTELNCSIKRLEFTKGSVGDTSQFSIGNVIGNSMTAEVLDLTDDVKGQTLEIQVGLYVDNQGGYEYIKIGDFVVSEVKKNIYGSTITGFSKLVSSSGGSFTEPATKTLANIGAEIGVELGCSVYFDTGIDTTKVIEESLNGMTTYQVVQIVAQVIGGYAVDLNNGSVKFYRYTIPASLNTTLTSGLMNTLPDMEEKDFEITGISCIVSEASDDIAAEGYTQGTPVNLSFNCKYMTQALFTELANSLIGYTYRPGSINLSLGDPRIEGWDVVQVIDADNSVYVVPCHSVRHIYDGGFRTEIISSSATHLENDIGTVSPLQQQKKDTDQQFVEVEAAIEELATGIQYFWHDNEGAHVCTIGEYHYNHMGYGEVCLEILITSSSIIFRHVRRALSSKVYTVYATYANTGIVLGDYASMTDAGIVLGDINDQYYQLILNASQGLSLNNSPIIISDYATDEITEITSTKRICAGFIDGDSTTLTFTVPLECIVPEGTSVNISKLRANFKIDGTSYFIDGSYYLGGYTWLGSNYTATAAVAGTAMTIILTKNTTFKKHGTSTAVDPYSSITCEIDRLTWIKPATNRSNANNSLKSMQTVETKAIEPPTEETR